MTEHSTNDGMHDGISRRTMIVGLGAATGVAGIAAMASPSIVSAGAAPALAPSLAPGLGGSTHVAAITAPIAGLSYVVVDGVAFFSQTSTRAYDTNYGVRSTIGPAAYAPLLLPTGSVLKQLNVTYQGSVVAYIDRRMDTAPYWESLYNTGSTPISATPASASYDVNITLEHGKSYILRFTAEALPLVGPPQFLGSMGIGYVPPPSGFMPYTGATPRILDTRLAGGKIQPGDAGAREINFGISGAKAAVINLTADQTVAYGYFSVYPANVPWPGNSSLNWTGPNVTIANTVIAPLSPDGKIKLRAGESAAQAIVDVQGFLY